jgi:ABC-type nitrate/sulfonate/bicarbonate transport system substrate-binding protein
VKRTSILAAVLALVVAAAACGGGSSAQESHALDKVTVVLDWTPNTNHSGVYLARAKGWYRDAGLDVKIIQPGDAGAVQLLGSGKADVAYSPQEEIIPARAQGVPVVAIAAVIQHDTSRSRSPGSRDRPTSPVTPTAASVGPWRRRSCRSW